MVRLSSFHPFHIGSAPTSGTASQKPAFRFVLSAVGLLCLATVSHAQLVPNPRIVEFSPSADHYTILPGGAPAVSHYSFEVYVQGATAPFHTVDMGKPAPEPDGKIRYDFSSGVSGWPLPGGVYESRVVALGPNGAGRSAASNPFTFSGTGTCTFTVSPTSATLGAAGGTTSVTLSTGSGCAWTAGSSASWITVSPTGGSGSGSATLTVAANSATTARSGTATIAGQTVTVTQAGAASCTFGVSPTAATVAAAGQTLTVNLTTEAGCAWGAASNASWITLSATSGTGSWTLFAAVAPNAGSGRTGTLSIAGQTVTITQASANVVTVSTEPQLQAAVRSASPNTTILIAAGTYRLTSTLDVRGVGGLTLRGATGNRDDVVLLGPGLRNGSFGSAPSGIWTDSSGLTVADLTVRDFYVNAIVFAPGAQAPRLTNLRLGDTGQQIVRADPDGAGGGVNGGLVERTLLEYTDTGRDASAKGIEIQTANSWIIRDNYFRNIRAPVGSQAGPAVLAWNGSSNTVVERNSFLNCQRGIALGAVQRAPNDHTGGVVRNNFFYRAAGEPLGDSSISVCDSPNRSLL